MTSILAATFWEQNRLVVALVLTLGMAAVAGVVYAISTQRQRLASFLSSSKLIQAIKLYRLVLGGAAILVFASSFFPRSSSGMGALLYFFLWPLVGVQFGLSFLPWQRMAQKDPSTTAILAGVIGFFAFFIDRMMLQLAGYVA